MAMAAAMAAMMLPTAVPFIVAFTREVRRPESVAVAVATYAAFWAIIGFGVYLVMSALMLPSARYVAGVAIAFAGAYALMPWKRRGQARCQQMCREPVADASPRAAVKTGLRYAVNCLACSAGIMVAVVVLGMSSAALMAGAAALILIYKLSGAWPRRIELALSPALVLVGLWVAI